MNELDLHGVRYEDVPQRCHKFINANWGKEMKIITGNSFMMKQIVSNILKFYKLKFTLDNPHNMGYIIVRK